MKSINEHITDMLETLTDTSLKTNKKEEKLTDISSKLSTYEDHIKESENKRNNNDLDTTGQQLAR